MKVQEILSGAVVVIALAVSGCGGGSADTSAGETTVQPTSVASVDVVVEPTVGPASTPTEVPVVKPSDEELVEAARSALDTDGVRSLFAWDVLESSVDSGGVVSFTLCGWTGETVFDSVYESLWSTRVAGDGSLSARELGTSVTSGECLNTELIDSALAFTREYDDFYREVAAAPETFETDSRSDLLLTEGEVAVVGAAMQSWAEDGIHARATSYSGALPESASAAVLYRRFQGVDVSVLEFVTCREMDVEHGLYRGDVLIDDFSGGVDKGPHSVTKYSLLRDSDLSSWLIDASEGLVWSDCSLTNDDWVEAVNSWRPDPGSWTSIK